MKLPANTGEVTFERIDHGLDAVARATEVEGVPRLEDTVFAFRPAAAKNYKVIGGEERGVSLGDSVGVRGEHE